MGPVVESARKTDIPRLVEIYSCQELHGSRAEAEWYVRSHIDHNSILVARVDGKIQGSCIWRIEGEKVCGTGWIEDMWVEKEFRRLGLGEKLLRKAVADLKVHFSRDGFVLRKIFLTAQVTNRAAISLYKKVGFIECGRVDSMYKDGITALIYGIDARLKEP
jgi:ribosomal protein S18 acetylase RimI-like enzyme